MIVMVLVFPQSLNSIHAILKRQTSNGIPKPFSLSERPSPIHLSEPEPPETPAMHPSIPSAHLTRSLSTNRHLRRHPHEKSQKRHLLIDRPSICKNVSSCRHPRGPGVHTPAGLDGPGPLIRHPAYPSRDFPRPHSADSHLISLTSCSCGFFLVMTIPEISVSDSIPYFSYFFFFFGKGEEELTCSLLSSIT
jgi:hypothetical protein